MTSFSNSGLDDDMATAINNQDPLYSSVNEESTSNTGNDEIDYDFELKGEKIDEYYCLICFLLLRDIAQMPCKHMLCKHCLDGWGK